MRTKTLTAVLLTAAITTVSSAGLAGFSSADWQSAGDGLLTVDANGNTWLDWAHTENRSYNDVSSQLGVGGEFEGFRYATEAELSQLYANAGAPVVNPLFTIDAAYIGPLTALGSLLGIASGFQANALYDLPGSASDVPSANGELGGPGPFHMMTAFAGPGGAVSMRWHNADDNATIASTGHALILIPAPGSAALLGLSGLIAARRRRN